MNFAFRGSDELIPSHIQRKEDFRGILEPLYCLLEQNELLPTEEGLLCVVRADGFGAGNREYTLEVQKAFDYLNSHLENLSIRRILPKDQKDAVSFAKTLLDTYASIARQSLTQGNSGERVA